MISESQFSGITPACDSELGEHALKLGFWRQTLDGPGFAIQRG